VREALEHWAHAGQIALQNSANQEAIMHFNKGLELVARVPDSEQRSRQELDFWLGLWPAYMATRGFSTSEVEQAALHARELSERLGDIKESALARLAMFAVRLVRAELSEAREEADAALILAQAVKEPQLIAVINLVIGDVCFWQGKQKEARRYLAEALIPWDFSKAKALTERTGLDAHCIGLVYQGANDFVMGHGDRSRVAVAESLRDSQALGNAQTGGHCLGVAGWLAVIRRDVEDARQLAARTIEYCREQRLRFWEASGYLTQGWVMIQDGKVEEGIRRVNEGIDIRRAAGAALVHSTFYAILAECHLHANEHEAARELIAKGLDHVRKTGEGLSESELLRVQGELLAVHADVNAARQSLESAIEVARGRDAKCFELRAAVSLARMLKGQGKRTEAHHLLAPTYNWFTEGFDSKDLQEAKELLRELSH
jgi:predicted ATPase